MKKFLALAACALLFSPLAKAQYVLTIDLTDINNVVISATGENSSTDAIGVRTASSQFGVTLMGFFSGTSNVFGSAFTSSLLSDGMNVTYPYAAVFGNSFGVLDIDGFLTPGVDLTIAYGGDYDTLGDSQIFSTLLPAFSGSMTLNLNLVDVISLLPAIGTTGDIRVGDGSSESSGEVIGQYRVVPEPSTALLVTAAGVAFLARRRR
jgi:hypothetical protein